MKFPYKALCYTLAWLGLFLLVFFALQQNSIYQPTLGKISSNYERTGTWDNFSINQVKKPYVTISNENTLGWDAAIYYSIKKHWYIKDIGEFGLVKAAFFPLFPLVWKATGLNPMMICLFNYLLFALSLYFLIQLLAQSAAIKAPAFLFSLLMPSVIIYCIPYSEAVFMMSFTLAVAGMVKRKYGLYFIGMLLTAMTRPATAFLLIAMICIEILALVQHRSFRTFFKECVKKFTPYMLGIFLVFLMYYINTGNWWELFRAQTHWDNTFAWPDHIFDWSVEGFGINIFTICFLIIPAGIYLFRQLVRSLVSPDTFISTNIFNGNTVSVHYYLVQVSLLYFIWILIYQLLFKGGGLHGLFRYVMASPLFYLTLVYYLQQSINISLLKKLVYYALGVVLLVLGLRTLEYGQGDRFNFSYTGMYLCLLLSFILTLYHHIPPKIRNGLLAIGFATCVIWSTFLFNMFLCYAWIFT